MATKTHKPPTRMQLQAIVDGFNRNFPVGTIVVLRKDKGEVTTAVRSPAEILSGHSAVAWFSGISGCYSIEDDRVRLAGDDVRRAYLSQPGG